MSTAALNSNPASSRTGLKVLAWVLQALGAAAFLMAGSTKLFQPMEALHTMMPWTLATPDALVRFIGTAEVFGAFGLILPALTRIKPILTPVAGVALVAVMVLASAFHVSRGELGVVPINAVLAAIVGAAAYLRARVVPVLAR